ncbi:hypothetical protein DK847_12865 [Aestuariivirga litoralis]|uniref:Uncharacterized protein n=1 Tax=Aestuariivirga litoralis TaxID=2650924 RepID=A0A2W2BL89_9HYPH|nr:hypothetical protein DK847_12865 [Aestuariivirga litoralis]
MIKSKGDLIVITREFLKYRVQGAIDTNRFSSGIMIQLSQEKKRRTDTQCSLCEICMAHTLD